MTRALVTGVAGFIGSNLTDALLDRGYAVRGLDTFLTGTPENLTAAESNADFSLIEGDIRDEETVHDAMEDVDCVFHQAAVPSVPRSVEDPVTTTDGNCTGTATVLDAARRADVESVVVASSSSVYGSSETLPKVETMTANPESPYALSKYYTERLTIQCSDLYGIDTAALRYFNVFGPRQDPEGEYAAVIPKFIHRLLDGKPPVIYGDGEQSRDFTYIDNVIQANILAAEQTVGGEAYNIACGERITINALAERLAAQLGVDIEAVHDDPRPGDVPHSMADISKARDQLGYEPEVDFEEGLQRTIEWYQS